VRIVGGVLRGRRLAAPKGDATRPTLERVREALFDILQREIAGAAFLDLFAGTGAVGIEAWSRGARPVVFVEERAQAVAALRRNMESLGVTEMARVLPLPAARALRLLCAEGFRAEVIFADPPYAEPRWPDLLAGLGESGLLSPGGLLVVEHALKRPPETPAGLERGRSYKYGDTGLTVFWRTGGLGDEVSRGIGD